MRKFVKTISTLPGNMFGVLFWNFLFAIWPFTIFIGLLALTGIRPMMVNDEPATAIQTIFLTFGMAPGIALVFAASTWMFIMIGHLMLRMIVIVFGLDD